MPFRHVPPSASALIESLRGTGYSLETAIADLIDNSIAAESSRVDLTFEWNDGAPIILLNDNGKGMSEQELLAAMRFGGDGPHITRDSNDLGRFGLGLKTASLSQCRRLTVLSAKEQHTNAFCWDLDHLKKAGDAWEVLEGVALELRPWLPHQSPTGTLVIWDRIDFGRVREHPKLKPFLTQMERTEKHLAMVFHRYLNGDARRLSITINGRRIKAWDPFQEQHEATIARPEQKLDSGGEPITVRGFILPHPDRFSNQRQMDEAAGPEGWNAQQGFYVYRQKRLLSAGGWLGLGGSRAWTREEFSRLARIRVDLPNTIDEDWRIDIRKAQARPPEAVREALSKIAEDVRRVAREVFVHRGRRIERDPSDRVARIWEVGAPDAARRYRIRRDHPLVRIISQQLGDQTKVLDSFIELLERTVPVDRIWLDAVDGGSPPKVQSDQMDYSALLETAKGIARSMVFAGMSRSDAAAAVARMEPFDSIEGVEQLLQRE